MPLEETVARIERDTASGMWAAAEGWERERGSERGREIEGAAAQRADPPSPSAAAATQVAAAAEAEAAAAANIL